MEEFYVEFYSTAIDYIETATDKEFRDCLSCYDYGDINRIDLDMKIKGRYFYLPAVLKVAVHLNKTVCINRILDLYDISKDLDTKQRLTYYKLFVKG